MEDKSARTVPVCAAHCEAQGRAPRARNGACIGPNGQEQFDSEHVAHISGHMDGLPASLVDSTQQMVAIRRCHDEEQCGYGIWLARGARDMERAAQKRMQ